MSQQTSTALPLIPVGQAVRQLDLAPVASQINVLGPRAMVYAGEGMRLRPIIVRVSPNPEDGDVYKRDGKLALTKLGLLKLSETKGVTWSDAHSRRVDDAPPCSACVEKAEAAGRRPYCPHNVGFRAVGAWLDPAGQWQTHSATKYWLCDEEWKEVERTVSDPDKVQAEFDKRYRDRLALAETKAKLRVIREIGVKATYTEQELAKGFLCVRVEPDLTPEQTRQRGLASASQIFGPEFASAAALPAPEYDLAQELDGEEDEPEQAEATSEASPWEDDPPTPTREQLIQRVETDWTAATAAVAAKKIEAMPPKPPSRDAPLSELLAWCESCEGFLGIGGAK
jgi:hypothetical protein